MSTPNRTHAPLASPATPSNRSSSPAVSQADIDELREHLLRSPPSLPCKYFYDERGSALFEQITVQPEYYPTRTETAILRQHAAPLLATFRPLEIAEIGSGSGIKTELLVEAGLAAGSLARVTVFDVAEAFLQESAARMQQRWPMLGVSAVVGDFTKDLQRLGPGKRRLLVFLAGTIGNLAPQECSQFLTDVQGLLGPEDAMLLGVDLIKDPVRLTAAYDDAAGVTAAFNLHILNVINRRFDGDFEPDDFRHVAVWNAELNRIEMRLRAVRSVTARVASTGVTLRLPEGSDLLTELSCKYSKPLLTHRLKAAGLRLDGWTTDEAGLFGLAVIKSAVPT